MKNYTRVLTLVSSGFLFSACGAVEPTADDSKNTTESASVDTTKTPPVCTPNDVFLMAETDHINYRPGMTVNITSTIFNVSTHACSLGVGPANHTLSPLVGVNDTTSNQTQLWSDCYWNDEHGACFTTWTYQTLNPGASYTRTYPWDQGTNMPLDGAVHRIPDGMYGVSTSYASVGVISDPVYIIISG